MRKLSFLLVLCCALTACREKYTEYYDDGSLKYEVELINKKPEGKALKYFNNGTLMQESNWVEGLRDGPLVMYYQNGNIRFKTEYRLGEENGIREEYDSLGNIFKKYRVENSIANGFCQVYNSDGKVILQGDFLNDVQDSMWIKFYDDGQLFGKYFMKDGKDIYKKEYEKSGDVVNVKFPIEVTKVPDDDLAFKIGIGFSAEPNISLGAIICSKIVDGLPIDTLTRLKSDSLSFVYRPLKRQIKDDKIWGILFEIEKDKNQILGACPFVYKINFDSLLYPVHSKVKSPTGASL